MTKAELSRSRSLAALEQRWQAHAACAGQARSLGNNWRLYCVQHNKWITNIPHDQLHCLLDEEIGRDDTLVLENWLQYT